MSRNQHKPDRTEESPDLPSDWEETRQQSRERMRRQMKTAISMAVGFGVGMAVGVVLIFVVPEFGFPLAFLAAGGLAFNVVRYARWKQQLEGNFVFGPRSFHHGKNRVLLRSGPDRLHVRISSLIFFVCLFALLASCAFFTVTVAGVLESLGDPTAMVRSRSGRGVPTWVFGVVMSIGGVAFGAIGLLPLLCGWRFDFDRSAGAVRFWNWFRRHELPLSIFSRVEARHEQETVSVKDRRGRSTGRTKTIHFQSIDLRVKDQTKSRLHVMCDNMRGDAGTVLREFLFPEDVQRGDLDEPTVLRGPTNLPTLRSRNAAIASLLILVMAAGAIGGHFIYRRFVPAPVDYGELGRFVGRWRGEFTGPNGQPLVLNREGRLVTDGHFLRVIETRLPRRAEQQGVQKALMFWQYNEATDQYRMWRFASTGRTNEFSGTWIASERRFEMASADENNPQQLVVKFTADDRSASELTFHQGNEERTVRWTLQRTEASGDLETQWHADNKPERIVPGMFLMAKRIGEWEGTARRQSVAGNVKVAESSQWILGGHFVESRIVAVGETGPDERVMLTGYAPASNLLRLWSFSRSGVVDVRGEVGHPTTVVWEPGELSHSQISGQWTFGSITSLVERWQWPAANEGIQHASVDLKRKKDVPPAVVPPTLKPRPQNRRRRLSAEPLPQLVPPTGGNLLASTKVTSTYGSAPASAFDGDPATAWEAGTSLTAEFESSQTIRRFVVRYLNDRVYTFGIMRFDESADKWRSHVRLRFHSGQLSPTGEFKDHQKVPHIAFVNGQPLEQYVQQHDLGSESQQHMEYQIVLPEAIRTTGVRLVIMEASAAPVLVSEFEAYAD